MKKKFLLFLMATSLGAGIGAFLGYGPLLRYKSEGILNMEMGTSEYKRFTELANDSASITQFIKNNPPPQNQEHQLHTLLQIVTKGEWHKSVAKVSKLDSKELSEPVLQMEREAEKEREKENTVSKRKPATVFLGLKLSYVAADPKVASDTTAWLGNYFKEVATREAVREQITRWSADNLQFTDRALVQKLKYEFLIEQAKNRVSSLKRITTTYPDIAGKQSNQVIDVRKDNEKFISPMAQLVGAESEIIEISENIRKLNREIEQQKFAADVLLDVIEVMKKTSSGSESVSKVAGVFAKNSKKISSDAEREALLSFAAELSQISARFLTQSQFITTPSVPTRPERPSPIIWMALMGLLFAIVAALCVWHNAIANFFKQRMNN